jgi:hydrogenase nickel incorporation protein HypB
MSTPRLVEVRQNVLKANDVMARALRQRFHEARVLVVSLVSSPGSGKTAFLEKTLTMLQPRLRVAALVGDLATENDAARLRRSQARVAQIITGTVCHLDASMVQNALEGWDLAALDFLFIENVGNLVCPASYDLGEDLRLVLMSVTEGEDKPLKYPTIFNGADIGGEEGRGDGGMAALSGKAAEWHSGSDVRRIGSGVTIGIGWAERAGVNGQSRSHCVEGDQAPRSHQVPRGKRSPFARRWLRKSRDLRS